MAWPAVISHCCGVWKSKTKVVADPKSGQDPLGFVNSHPLLASSHAKSRQEVIWHLFLELIPPGGLHPCGGFTSQRPCLPIPFLWVLGRQSKGLRSTQTCSPQSVTQAQGPVALAFMWILTWKPEMGYTQGSWQVSWLLWKTGREAWAQPLCSAHCCRSPHQRHYSGWVVIPSVNLESRWPWVPCGMGRHGSPLHRKWQVTMTYDLWPYHYAVISLHWLSDRSRCPPTVELKLVLGILADGPWPRPLQVAPPTTPRPQCPAHDAPPMTPRPLPGHPSHLEFRPPALQKHCELPERAMPSPPLQLCWGQVFCMRSSSSRQWKDVRTWPHGRKVMAVLTIWNQLPTALWSYRVSFPWAPLTLNQRPARVHTLSRSLPWWAQPNLPQQILCMPMGEHHVWCFSTVA